MRPTGHPAREPVSRPQCHIRPQHGMWTSSRRTLRNVQQSFQISALRENSNLALGGRLRVSVGRCSAFPANLQSKVSRRTVYKLREASSSRVFSTPQRANMRLSSLAIGLHDSSAHTKLRCGCSSTDRNNWGCRINLITALR